MSPGELEGIDRVRGVVPRQRWIKALCADAVAACDALSGASGAVGAVLAGDVRPGRPAERPVRTAVREGMSEGRRRADQALRVVRARGVLDGGTPLPPIAPRKVDGVVAFR